MARLDFDRIAVHDLRPFAALPRFDVTESLISPGIPVVEDENVEVGVVELRKRVLVDGEWRDETVDRLYLLELRA